MAVLPILYSFRRCPYAMRARMALLVSGTVVELREILLRDKPAAMLDVSPKGTVPVLLLPDGRVIDESIDIMRWALAQNDPDDWRRGDDRDLIADFDGPFKYHLDRTKYPGLHSADPLEHRPAAMAFVAMLEQRLAMTPFLVGARPLLTDFAIMPFVRQFAAIDPAWFAAQPVPHVQHWLAQLIGSDLFAAAMARISPWVPK